MENIEDKYLNKRDNFQMYHHITSMLIAGSLSGKKYKYSIVIPTYKRAKTLKETVESAIYQNYQKEFSIVIVDNNSERNDDTEIYIRSLSVPQLLYYKNEENIGMVGNWNRCIELCNGTYMIMVHDDDILSPNFITTCERVLTSALKVDILYPLKIHWQQGEEEKPQFSDDFNPKMKINRLTYYDYLLGNDNPPTGMLINRHKAIEIGGFAEKTYPSADYYFNVEAIRFLHVYSVQEKLLIYRWGGNITLKLSTLLGFGKQDIPLKIWLMDKLGIPKYCKEAFLKVYCSNLKKMISLLYPNDYSKIDFSNYKIFKNSLDKFFCIRLCNLVYRLIGLRRKFKTIFVS